MTTKGKAPGAVNDRGFEKLTFRDGQKNNTPAAHSRNVYSAVSQKTFGRAA